MFRERPFLEHSCVRHCAERFLSISSFSLQQPMREVLLSPYVGCEEREAARGSDTQDARRALPGSSSPRQPGSVSLAPWTSPVLCSQSPKQGHLQPSPLRSTLYWLS